MFKNAFVMVVLSLAASRAGALDGPAALALEDACVNEIGILCRSAGQGAPLLRCLDQYSDQALPGCRAAIAAEHEAIQRRAAEREAALALARVQAQAGIVSAEIEARLVKLQGAVYVHMAGLPEGQFVAAEQGMALSAGDLLRVGLDGASEIALEGRSLLALAANGDLTVDSLDPADIEFHLGLGTLVAKLAKVPPASRMTFVTPTAAAAVRGAELGIEQPPADAPARIGVFDEGHAAVSAPNGGQEVTLKPNQETQVARGQVPAPAAALSTMKGSRAALIQARRRLIEVKKLWTSQSPQARAAQRVQVAQRPKVSALDMPNVLPAQRQRAYPDARQRRLKR